MPVSRLVADVEPAARVLNMSSATLYRRAKEIGAKRVGRRLLLPVRWVADVAGVSVEDAVAAIEAAEAEIAEERRAAVGG